MFYESLNFASLHKLPILFVCENNLYSVYSPLSVRQPAHRSLSQLAAGHGIRTIQANGNDAEAVADISVEACEEIRKGLGPVFLELPTYRWREHCGTNYDNDIGYRTKDEFLEWKRKDPIELLARHIPANKKKGLEEKILKEIEQAFDFAKSRSASAYGPATLLKTIDIVCLLA